MRTYHLLSPKYKLRVYLAALIIIFIPRLSSASLPSSDSETFISNLSFIDDVAHGKNNSFSIDWQWKDNQGKDLQLHSFFSANSVQHSLLDSYKVSFSLNYPIKAIHTYLSPRLEFAIQRINHYTPKNESKIASLKSAFTDKEDTSTSLLFWQAYNQYQDDAFYHLKISPCIHPDDADLPCVRPNYSQLFYEYRAYLKDVATQLANKQSLTAAVKNAQDWVYTIPNRAEQLSSFFPPISVLQSNEADSDEKALLLATLVSQLAPKYQLYMLYPSSSIGSVSPVWLTIESKSGIEGKKVIINSNQYTVISGSKSELEKMISSNTEMTSESLY
jgi:hypothetical protein